MAAKIIAFLLTAFVNVVVGYLMFIFVLLALNGFSESDAQYGVLAYIALAAVITLVTSGLAAFGTHLLQKRGFRGWSAVLITFPASSVIGGGLKLVSAVIGVHIADLVSKNL
ncbi:MAG: hypothetical protein QUS14_09090 [Pyrinomonadaceae bacterium]|nr:hypothetical protein [Pyrinomonadaceae bacterium]